jgi:RNA polymerase sigma-70 factor (ECF subfamily)
MTRVARGDQSALAELYDELAPMVFRIALLVTRDQAQSERVTQDVFVELWRHAARFDRARCSVRSWAQSITVRRATACVASTAAAM